MPTTTQTLQKGRFSIEQELYSNGSCTHFQAYDTEDEEAVSIFEIVPQLPKVATVSQRESLEAAFAARAKSVSLLKQRAFPAVLDWFTEGGRYYVVTKCVSGSDLFSIASDQEKAFTTNELADWADSILEALNALHNSRPSIVYGNLHPENVILGQDGTVTLSISGLFHGSGPNSSANVAEGGSAIAFSPLEQIWNGLDAASQKVIINQYDEASERILKQELDARSDIYSIGATLYFLATGRMPVDALERSIEMIEGNADPLVVPNKLDPSVPTEVSDVIMKAMEIRREYRFDSAAIMRQVLRTALVRVKERGGDASTPVANGTSPVKTEPARNGYIKAVPADDVSRRLREAEEKRLEAERRAAEAEKKLREAEEAQARLTDSFNLSQLDDDVLGLLGSTRPNTSATDLPADDEQAAASSENDVDITPIFDDAASKPTESNSDEVIHQTEPAIQAEDDPPLPESTSVGKETQSKVPQITSDLSSSAPEFDLENVLGNDVGRSKGSFPFGIPAIAAAAAVLCVVAVGGWFMLSGGPASDAATTSQAPSASSSQETPAEPPVQSAYQPDETIQQPASEISSEQVPAGDQQAVTQADKAPAPKAKKAAPARTPAPKKAVTVDDLINDN